ncbi:MAG: hypothetical protein IMW99_07840 [Firmicutes bacterium]|nr:hypothetical protein [Bacillota bacterium]
MDSLSSAPSLADENEGVPQGAGDGRPASRATEIAPPQQRAQGGEELPAAAGAGPQRGARAPRRETRGLAPATEGAAKGAAAQKRKGSTGGTRLRRYTPEEDAQILAAWHDPAKRGELARRLGRPVAGLAYRFYQILRERNMDPSQYRREMRARFGWHRRLRRAPAAAPETREATGQVQVGLSTPAAAPATPTSGSMEIALPGVAADHGLPAGSRRSFQQDELFDALREFPRRADALERQIVALTERVRSLEEGKGLTWQSLITSLTELQNQTQERQQMATALEELRLENRRLSEKLEEERRRMAAERDEMARVYQDLEAVLHEFMHLSSVDKLRVLGDFATKLEVTVDRFGSVVRTRRVV